MSATTFSKFFWADWLSDAALRSCSALARGLWMDMLCLAGQAQRHGYVMVGPSPATPVDLARLSGETVETVEKLLEELETKDVFSRDRDGVIYSRRMIRDQKRRAASAKGGKIGGAITSSSKKGIHSTRGTTPDSTATSHKPESTSHQPQQVAPQWMNRLQKLTAAFGTNIEAHPGGPEFLAIAARFEQRGIDFDLDLLPAIREWAADGHTAAEFTSLAFFEKRAQKFHDRRVFRESAQAALPAPETLTPEQWHGELEKFLRRGIWPTSRLGPSPIEDGCRADPEMRARAQSVWDKQFQRPRDVDPVLWLRKAPVPFWNVVPLAKQA